ARCSGTRTGCRARARSSPSASPACATWWRQPPCGVPASTSSSSKAATRGGSRRSRPPSALPRSAEPLRTAPRRPPRPPGTPVTLSATLALTLVLSIAIGRSLGLLGGGGSILAVPILAYVAGLDAKEAIAASLFVVGVTSAVGVVSHARAGRVRWRTGLVFGGAAMAGAFGGGLLGGFVPGQILMVAFALMMLATAAAMIRGRRGSTEPRDGDLPVLTVLAEGLVVGLVTGIVGAGGGFL